MYNELQKRYVKETKINKEQSEAIKNLTVSRICRSWYQTANYKLLGRLKSNSYICETRPYFLYVVSHDRDNGGCSL